MEIDMEPVLEIKNLNKSFKDTRVLSNLNLTVYPGEAVYIKGRNGSGKSTLLKIIAGLLEADGGEVIKAENAYIGALIENPSFVPYASLKDNLLFLYGLRHSSVSTREYSDLETLCESFDLSLNNRKPVKTYSIGMKQKAGIIQAIMENQNLILLDEPTRGLDDESIAQFIRQMQELSRQGKTIVVTAHDFVDIGYTRKMRLENGCMVED